LAFRFYITGGFIMKKYMYIALANVSLLAAAAYADTTPGDVTSDKGAIHKDNADIAHQNNNIAVNRREKAAAKANDNPIDQASQSAQIGANKAMRSEKDIEKDVDQKILKHDQKNLDEGK